MGFKQTKIHRTDAYWYHQVGIVRPHFIEQAMDNLESAGDYPRFMHKAGYDKVSDFNLDGSHMEWQSVSVIDFIREYGYATHCAYMQGRAGGS